MEENKNILESEMELELKKFTEDIEKINVRLKELDAQREELVRIGLRLEGVVSYLRSKVKKEGNGN